MYNPNLLIFLNSIIPKEKEIYQKKKKYIYIFLFIIYILYHLKVYNDKDILNLV